MTQTSQIKQYIYNWLTGLDIGQVFLDRRPMDDTSKMRAKRTYVIFYFEEGIEDRGGFFEGECTVVLGARDVVRFTSPEVILAEVEYKFLAEFDKNDTNNGISLIAVDKVDDGPDNVGNHEYVYKFTVYAEKGSKGVVPNSN